MSQEVILERKVGEPLSLPEVPMAETTIRDILESAKKMYPDELGQMSPDDMVVSNTQGEDLELETLLEDCDMDGSSTILVLDLAPQVIALAEYKRHYDRFDAAQLERLIVSNPKHAHLLLRTKRISQACLNYLAAKNTFYIANQNGHRIIKFLVEESRAVSANCEVREEKGSLLEVSLRSHHTEAISKYLVEQGADINRQDQKTNVRPMTVACRHHRHKLTDALLAKGVQLNYLDYIDLEHLYMSPLMLFAARGETKRIHQLLKHGAMVDFEDYAGRTALFYAVERCQHRSAVRALLEAGANPTLLTNIGENVRAYADGDKMIELLDEFIKKWGATPLAADTAAPTVAPAPAASIVAAIGAIVAATHHAETIAMQNSRLFALRVSARNAMCAHRVHQAERLRIMASGCVQTQLVEAARCGQLEIVKELVMRGANVNTPNNFSMTPLGTAVDHQHYEVAHFLITKGASPVWATVRTGVSVATWALNDRKVELVKAMVKYTNFNINARMPNGDTGIIYALRHGDTLTAHVYLEAGADLDAWGAGGETALVVAIRQGFAFFAEVLLGKGVSFYWVDAYHNTPLSLAQCAYRHGNQDMARVVRLIERLADRRLLY